jgi:hypothetical protein
VKPIPEENSVAVDAVVAIVLVNRVSDASPTATVKKTSVKIALFGLHFVPVSSRTASSSCSPR